MNVSRQQPELLNVDFGQQLLSWSNPYHLCLLCVHLESVAAHPWFNFLRADDKPSDSCQRIRGSGANGTIKYQHKRWVTWLLKRASVVAEKKTPATPKNSLVSRTQTYEKCSYYEDTGKDTLHHCLYGLNGYSNVLVFRELTSVWLLDFVYHIHSSNTNSENQMAGCFISTFVMKDFV